ncbi:hypothetical protein BJ741DRAFT_623440 [Chytriomyces cf. hyalinus JEL632]|nr:hypothetical protein BJ741DRAFT_623440 [Chytriomyces cf. hyalinus JEL632]
MSQMASSTEPASNPSHPIFRHTRTSSPHPAGAISLMKRHKSLITVKNQSSNEYTKLSPSQTGAKTPDSPVLQNSSDTGVLRRGSLSVSSVSDAPSALPNKALECRAISHDSFTQSNTNESHISSSTVHHRSQVCTTIMEDAATIENGRLEEAFEQEAQSSRHSPMQLENHQAEDSFLLDDYSFQIPNSRQSFSFTQSPLRGSPLSQTFRDLHPDESFREGDLSVTASQDANIESCRDEEPSDSSHESLTKQFVLLSTPFNEMKEQSVLEPSALCPGDEAKLTRPTTIKRGTSLVFADKRSPERSIQKWVSMFDLNPNNFAFNLKLEAKEALFSREDISHKQPVQSKPAASTSPTPYNTSAEVSPIVRVVYEQKEWSEISMKHSASEVEQSSFEVLPWQQCVELESNVWEPSHESRILEMPEWRSSVPSRLNVSDSGKITLPNDVRDACLVENGEPVEIPKPIECPRESSAPSSFEEMAHFENISCEYELVRPCREQENLSAAASNIQNNQKPKNTPLRVPLSSTQHTLASISKPAVSPVENVITENYAHVRSVPNNNVSKPEPVQKSFAKPIPASFSQDRSFSQLLKDAKTDNQKLHTVLNRANNAVDTFKSAFENLHFEHSKLRDRFTRVEDIVRQMKEISDDAKALASKPKLELDSQGSDEDTDFSKEVLEYMKYIKLSHTNPTLGTPKTFPKVETRKASKQHYQTDLFTVV